MQNSQIHLQNLHIPIQSQSEPIQNKQASFQVNEYLTQIHLQIKHDQYPPSKFPNSPLHTGKEMLSAQIFQLNR